MSLSEVFIIWGTYVFYFIFNLFFLGETENLNAVTEIMYGVRDFFDTTVGRLLLYNIEKPQFNAVMEQVWHFIRLKSH